jgi:hypothetical protein
VCVVRFSLAFSALRPWLLVACQHDADGGDDMIRRHTPGEISWLAADACSSPLRAALPARAGSAEELNSD